MAMIPFTDNYTELSSNRGFQFKFFCQKCGSGYMSTFQTNTLGAAASAAAAFFRRAAPALTEARPRAQRV